MELEHRQICVVELTHRSILLVSTTIVAQQLVVVGVKLLTPLVVLQWEGNRRIMHKFFHELFDGCPSFSRILRAFRMAASG